MCSFFNLFDETPFHIFYECDRVKCSWWDLVQFFQSSLILPTSIPQIFCGFHKMIRQAMTLFSKRIKSFSIIFYVYLSYTFINPEKSNS